MKGEDVTLKEQVAESPVPPENAERALELLAHWAVRMARKHAEAAQKPARLAVTGGVSND